MCYIFGLLPKSNASYLAIGKAQQLVKKSGNLAVPLHLRNAPTDLMKELNYGTDYQYTHNQKGNFSQQEYLPDELINTCIYETGNNLKEKAVSFLFKESLEWKIWVLKNLKKTTF